jgi:cytochrome c-type biogenesis protein CcsB
MRSVSEKHAPFTNSYETLMLFPFLLSLRLVFWREQIPEKYRWAVLSLIVVLITVALILPDSLKSPRPSMPALNSIWIYIHVPAYFLGYVSIAIALLYSIVLLIKSENMNSVEKPHLLAKLDNEVKISFLFLNIGLITGAIWAYVSWGNYWAWDPKETWALINILVLSFYFHLQNATVKKKSIVVIITFLTIIFTYWGVSFILSGLHSYI